MDAAGNNDCYEGVNDCHTEKFCMTYTYGGTLYNFCYDQSINVTRAASMIYYEGYPSVYINGITVDPTTNK